MIQRIQTLFLLAVTIVASVMFFIPFQTFVNSENSFPICLMPGCSSEILNNNTYYPMILNLLVVILSIATIFLFKNRVLQYKLSNVLALLNVFIVGLFFLLAYVKPDLIGMVTFSFGAFLPSINVIFALFAAHFIKKDEQLVRSADRIR